MTRSRLILLDANVVIRLFELGIWERIAARHHVLLARTVLDESQFYEDAHGRQYIDWDRWSAAGTFEVRQAPPSEVAAYCRRFGPGYMEKLDAGEAESLVLMRDEPSARICSADKIVWRVLGNTGQSERGASLEELLAESGLTKPLPDRFSRRFRERWTRIGGQERFMGRGDRGTGS